jgi:hypothetical protein
VSIVKGREVEEKLRHSAPPPRQPSPGWELTYPFLHLSSPWVSIPQHIISHTPQVYHATSHSLIHSLSIIHSRESRCFRSNGSQHGLFQCTWLARSARSIALGIFIPTSFKDLFCTLGGSTFPIDTKSRSDHVPTAGRVSAEQLFSESLERTRAAC